MSETGNQPENRKPWQFQPGQSGNPHGRPKGTVSLTNLLRKKLLEGTCAQDVIDATIRDALAGDAAARKLVWERMEGLLTQPVNIKFADKAADELTDDELLAASTALNATSDDADADAL
jgi:hypothetical protein